MNNYIFLIHGFCGKPLTFLPIKWALIKRGYKNIHILQYSSTILSLKEAIELIYKQIIKIININKINNIILIGHSFGGVISYNLYKLYKHLPISLLILITCPLKSCRFLKSIHSYLPSKISKFFLHKLPALQDLLECNTNNKEINITIPYYTITTNLFYSHDFDGSIYIDDAIIDKTRNFTIPNSSHNLLLINYECLKKICELLDNHFFTISTVENNCIKVDINN